MEEILFDLVVSISSLVGLVFFIVPGFITTTIISQFYIRRKKDTFDKTAESLIFSIISYLLSTVAYIAFINPKFFLISAFNELFPAIAIIYLLTILINIVLGFVLGTVYDRDLFNKLLRRKTSNALNLWVQLFSRDYKKKKIWCVIAMKNGKIFLGNLFKDHYDAKELFIKPVYLVKGGKKIPLEGGLYVTHSNIEYMRILDEAEVPSKKKGKKSKNR